MRAAIHEVATLSTKGQVTIPKAIRQVLGVEAGSKLAFDFVNEKVMVSRASADSHEDPAITSFLQLIANDIEAGENVRGLPKDLAELMLEHAGHKPDLDEEIDGDVAL